MAGCNGLISGHSAQIGNHMTNQAPLAFFRSLGGLVGVTSAGVGGLRILFLLPELPLRSQYENAGKYTGRD